MITSLDLSLASATFNAIIRAAIKSSARSGLSSGFLAFSNPITRFLLMSNQVGIVDYGCGNIKSVVNAVHAVGGIASIIDTPIKVERHKKIILPGVGAFKQAMTNLRDRDFLAPLLDAPENPEIAILGICLGMQIMCTCSYEGGKTLGLGWFDAEVISIKPHNSGNLKVPHIGWNTIEVQREHPYLSNVPNKSDVYFANGFCVRPESTKDALTTSDYGGHFVSSLHRANMVGLQFHPEKSHNVGLTIIKNFVDGPNSA